MVMEIIRVLEQQFLTVSLIILLAIIINKENFILKLKKKHIVFVNVCIIFNIVVITINIIRNSMEIIVINGV